MSVNPQSSATFLIRHDIYPARGRKPIWLSSCVSNLLSIRHDIYPARGRKPSGDGVQTNSFIIRHDIYPARGRKLLMLLDKIVKRREIRHDIYPARGRKQRSRKKAKVESKKNDSSPYQHKLTNQNPS